MSKKGENIYKRKDGRWEARYIKGYPTPPAYRGNPYPSCGSGCCQQKVQH